MIKEASRYISCMKLAEAIKFISCKENITVDTFLKTMKVKRNHVINMVDTKQRLLELLILSGFVSQTNEHLFVTKRGKAFCSEVFLPPKLKRTGSGSLDYLILKTLYSEGPYSAYDMYKTPSLNVRNFRSIATTISKLNTTGYIAACKGLDSRRRHCNIYKITDLGITYFKNIK